MNDTTETLPRWSVADVHESLESRSFVDALEQTGADSTRLTALFDEHDIRRCETRAVTEADGKAADAVLRAVNDNTQRVDIVGAYVYASVSTDSFDETAQGLLSAL
jgi:oligoendopeptidase F